MTDYYEILEVARSADREAIRAAITRQRRVWIRRQSSPDPARRAWAEDRVREIDQAERTLLDPAARAAFDRSLGGRAATGGGAPGSGPAGDPVTGSATAGSAGRLSAAQWRERARAYAAQSNHTAANRAAREAVTADPVDSTAWLLLAQTSAAAGRLDDAAYEYGESLRLREDLDARLGLADVYGRQEGWRAARGEYDAALRLDPDDLRARAGRCEAMVHTGSARDRRDGLRSLQALARAHPEDEHVQTTLGYALYNDTLASLAELRDGTRLPVSARQLRLVRRRARRIRALPLTDPGVEELRTTLRAMAREARHRVWVRGGHTRSYLVPAVPLLFLLLFSRDGPLVYLWSTLLIGLVAVYVGRHRRPVWRFRLTELGPRIVDRGI